MADLKFPVAAVTDIQVTGVDLKLHPDGYARLYGYRIDDAAMRLVGVAADKDEILAIMKEAGDRQQMPLIQVEPHQWFYVMTMGAGQAQFEAGQEPSKPS